MMLRELLCLKQSSWILLCLLFITILKELFCKIWLFFFFKDTFQRTSQMFTKRFLCLFLSQEYINISDISIWAQGVQLNFNTASHLFAWERFTTFKIPAKKCLICASYTRCTHETLRKTNLLHDFWVS